MKKLQLGTIGTGWIVDRFVKAAQLTDYYELNTVYSRTKEKGTEFAGKHGNPLVETDLKTFVDIPELDIIYIASPNSLHYEQSLLALRAKKHVLVEKPATINVGQWDHMLKVAAENDVFVIEAAKHMYMPNLGKIATKIKKMGRIRGATFPYVEYSSIYEEVLAGEEPNVFSPAFGGGVLMDLGVYPIYTAVALFGEPQSVRYFARKVKTGVDGSGTAILRYESFDVTILIGNIATSTYEVEIYGENETLIIDHVSHLDEARLLDNRTLGESELPLEAQHQNNMYEEALAFAKMIGTKDRKKTLRRYKDMSELARIVSGLLYEMRMQEDILFEGE